MTGYKMTPTQGILKPSGEHLNNVQVLVRAIQNRSWKGGKEVREMIKAEDMTRQMKAIRTSRGMTLEDVGVKMGKSRSAVNYQENNPLRLSVSTLMKFADVYGCEVADFFMPTILTKSEE